VEDLWQSVAALEPVIADLQDKHQQMQMAIADLQSSAASGKGDLTQLSLQVSTASERFQGTRAAALQGLYQVEQLLKNQALQARSRGVPVADEAPQRAAANGRPDDFSVQQMVGAAEYLRDGAQALLAAVREFDQLQAQIEQALADLRAEMRRLERYAPEAVDEMRGQVAEQESRFADVHRPRQPIQSDVLALVALCHEQADAGRERLIELCHNQIKLALLRLDQLGARSDERLDTFARLESRLEIPEDVRDLLLDDFESYAQDSVEAADRARHALDRRLEELAAEAREVIAELHPDMPEARALHDLLAISQGQPDAEVVAFVDRFEQQLAQARQAGLNALERYSQRTAADPNYLFSDAAEVAQLGMAILAASELPEQYGGTIWEIADDIVYRLEFTDIEAEPFRRDYILPAFLRALQAADERDEVALALSFLEAGFLLPVGEALADRVRALLRQPDIHAFFTNAIADDRLRLDSRQVEKLSAKQVHALLIFLAHADAIGIPTRVQLQWVATLLGQIAPAAPEHALASRLLLVGLMREERYVGVYYTLKVLGADHPELWEEPGFRPMLRPLVEQALALEDARPFLIDICDSPETARLVAGDFESQFLVAALAHFLVVHLGQIKLFGRALEAWEAMQGGYPALTDVLLRQLQGEAIESASIDPVELGKEYDRLLGLIAERLPTPPLNGVRLAMAIHRWYVTTYMQPWYQELQSKRHTMKQLEALLEKIAGLRGEGDLVDYCPLQREPPEPAMIPVQWRLKDRLNTRLFDLLDLLQRAVKIRQRLLSRPTAQPLPRDALLDELGRIAGRASSASWVVEHLLKPELPFIDELLTRAATE
jgi:hypothetical protein